MASLSILSLFLILFVFSIPIQSQKTQLSRRNLALTDQVSQEQPTIPNPSTKKKTVALIEQEEEGQPITKPTKKKKQPTSEKEQEESIPKPPTKKKKPDPTEQEEEQDEAQSIPEFTTKKKKISPVDQEGNQSMPKSTTKKKKQDPIEQEEEPAPKSTLKKKKLSPVEQEENQADPKPTTKKKKLSPIDQEQETPISKSTTKNNKKPTFDAKNQTKPSKPKKSNSTSNQLPTLTNSTSKSKPSKTLTLKPPNSTTKSPTKPINPIWLEEPDSDSDPDLITEFRDLPTRIHQALLPDLKKISITSKAYIYKANKNIAENMKPFVGNKFAPKIALGFSCIFLILPLCLVTFLFYHLNSYLSLQRLLIFVQAYLAIYFFTLSVTAMVTGLEPLRFFFATSPGSYAWTQAVQTLGYLLYLLLQLIHLVVVFSAGENRVRVRVLGLVQMIVGLAVGGHYYVAVFHRAVTREPPRVNWKVHGAYAVCFLLICLCARAENGKKAYGGGEDGKKS